MADHSSSFSFFLKRANAEQEISASAKEESVPQDTPLPPSSSFPILRDPQPPFDSNSFPLPPNNSPLPQESVPDQEKPTNQTSNPTPMITIDDDHTYQDRTFPTSDQLEQVFDHEVLGPVPFFDPSALNVPLPATSLVLESVPSIDGEADSSFGVSFRAQSIQEQNFTTLNNPYRNPFWPNAPPRWFYKLNVAVDQCVFEGMECLGMGAVIRNRDGVVQQALTRIWWDTVNPHPYEPETFIFRLGIRLSASRGYRRIIAETETHVVLEQYRNFHRAGVFEHFEARHISANDNFLSHAFARRAIESDNLEGTWTLQRVAQVFGSLLLPI